MRSRSNDDCGVELRNSAIESVVACDRFASGDVDGVAAWCVADVINENWMASSRQRESIAAVAARDGTLCSAWHRDVSAGERLSTLPIGDSSGKGCSSLCYQIQRAEKNSDSERDGGGEEVSCRMEGANAQQTID